MLNKTTKVKKDTSSTHPTRPYEALIHFKVGDFASDYQIKIIEHDIDSDTGEVDKDATALTTVTLKYATPDNETFSRTHTDGKQTSSLNNSEAVVVSNIAKTFNMDVDQILDLMEESKDFSTEARFLTWHEKNLAKSSKVRSQFAKS